MEKSSLVEKFDGIMDFSIWQMSMRDYLVVLDLDNALDGPKMVERKVKDSEEVELVEVVSEKWKTMDKKCLSEIRLHLTAKIKGHKSVKTATSAKQLWESLQDLFMANTMTNKIYIKSLIHDMRMEENTPVMDHLSTFDSLCSRLEAVGEELKDQDKALQLIWTLPESYKTLAQSFMSRSSFTSKEVSQALAAAEMMMKKDRVDNVSEGALVAMGTSSRGRKTNFKGNCYRCGLPGHCARDCRRKNDGNREQPAANPGATASIAIVALDEENVFADLLTPANVFGQGGWFMDCGAAMHICNNRSSYSTYEGCGGFVYMGDGSRLLVRGVGEVRPDLFDSSVQTITSVRHVPEVKWNLISLSKLESLGWWYSARCGVMSVYHGDDVILEASLCRGLYRLHEKVVFNGSREPESVCSGGASTQREDFGLGGGSGPLTILSDVPVMMSDEGMTCSSPR